MYRNLLVACTGLQERQELQQADGLLDRVQAVDRSTHRDGTQVIGAISLMWPTACQHTGSSTVCLRLYRTRTRASCRRTFECASTVLSWRSTMAERMYTDAKPRRT